MTVFERLKTRLKFLLKRLIVQQGLGKKVIDVGKMLGLLFSRKVTSL